MTALIIDTESNGFLETSTKIHCLVTKNTDTGESSSFTGDLNNKGTLRTQLEDSRNILVGHNIIKHDLPLIHKIYPGLFSIPESSVVDTLVCSRLIWPNLHGSDEKRIQQGKLPPKLSGSHSLKAWGYRLGVHKGDYAEDYKASAGDSYVPGDEWKECSQGMVDYCITDTEVTEALYKLILSKNYSQESLDLEHRVAFICAKMERTGFPFDVPKAVLLYSEIAQKRDDIVRIMEDTFEPEVIERVSEKTGKPLKTKVVVFNPSSRKQIGDRLTKKYGWKPTEFTPAGQPKIDETVLETLEYPEAKILAEYFTLEKRVGQLAEGDNAWLKLERKGILHGGYNTNGAVTGRCTHQTPNMGQVPAVRSIYGKECRELFVVPKGFTLVGTDLSGIEARLLAHFMSKYDSGAYATAVVSGSSKDGTDIHSVNQRAAGLSTRDEAKTFFSTGRLG